MRMAQVLRPKGPRNLKATGIAALVFILIYVAGSSVRPWRPSRELGLAFGVLAALVFVFEMLYSRRRPRARPLGTAQSWLQAHVYVGVLGMLAVVIHAGFRWPQGGLGWWLLVLSAWTTATGLLGVWLQKWIPVAMTEGLSVEAIYERIPSLVEQLLVEADALMEGASDVLDRFYRNEVRPPLHAVSPSWSFLLDVRGGRERALEPFHRLGQFMEEAEKEKVEDLMKIYSEKMELDAQYSLQGVLRRWPILHVPAAGLLMGLIAAHIFSWVWY